LEARPFTVENAWAPTSRTGRRPWRS